MSVASKVLPRQSVGWRPGSNCECSVLSFVASALGGIRATVFAAVAAAALAFAGVQSWRLRTARADVADANAATAAVRAENAALRGAAASAAITIRNLRDANAELADAARADIAEAERAAAAVERERDRLRGELQAERVRRAEIYRENEDAKRWAETLVPVAVVDRLLRDD